MSSGASQSIRGRVAGYWSPIQQWRPGEPITELGSCRGQTYEWQRNVDCGISLLLRKEHHSVQCKQAWVACDKRCPQGGTGSCGVDPCPYCQHTCQLDIIRLCFRSQPWGKAERRLCAKVKCGLRGVCGEPGEEDTGPGCKAQSFSLLLTCWFHRGGLICLQQKLIPPHPSGSGWSISSFSNFSPPDSTSPVWFPRVDITGQEGDEEVSSDMAARNVGSGGVSVVFILTLPIPLCCLCLNSSTEFWTFPCGIPLPTSSSLWLSFKAYFKATSFEKTSCPLWLSWSPSLVLLSHQGFCLWWLILFSLCLLSCSFSSPFANSLRAEIKSLNSIYFRPFNVDPQ